MSETHQDRRGSCSDFSIARILAKEDQQQSEGSAGATSEQPQLDIQRFKFEWLRNFCKLQQRTSLTDDRHRDRPSQSETITSAQPSQQSNHSHHFKSEELSWLRCTRYCPPKLPRKSIVGKSLKRKPGSHPRIPFTKHQLDVLEGKYKTNAYLSRKEVVHLSESLNIPQSRIKIWFQNRRARERRESLLEQKDTTDI